jgi:diguanylate cyclase (GGDEF)-like protein/PAS domain S-box-containing protein
MGRPKDAKFESNALSQGEISGTQCVEAVTELRRVREQLRAVQELARIGIWELRPADKHLSWSDEACRIAGIAGHGFEGSLEAFLAYVHPDDRQRVGAAFDLALQGKTSLDMEHRMVRPDGEFCHVHLRTQLLCDETGQLLFGTVQDVTELRRTQEAMRESEERFEIIAKATNDAIWDWHLQTNRVWWSEGMRSLFGFSHQEIENGIEWWTSHIHPEDRDRVLRGVYTAIDGPCEDWSDEYRFMRKDGSYVDVLDRGFFIRDRDGKAVRMIGAMVDITERARAERERREAEARIREQAALLDKAQDAIIVVGMDMRISFWNKGAERLFGWTAEETLGKMKVDLIIDDFAAFDEAHNIVLEWGAWSGELGKRRKGGNLLTVESHWTLVRDDNGRPQSILAIDTDITQRKKAEREIEHLAFFDPLTQLPNRRLLLDRLQHALATSIRSRHRGALLFIDLDNFKSLNDTLGHDKGDLLLQQVARRLETCVPRKSDTVARLGGDEFVVMLEDLSEHPQEAAAQAEIVGEKILAVFNQPFQLDGYEYHTTPSIGVTLFDNRTDNVDELLKRADLAMYQAKGAGRNAIRFFDPDMQTVVTARVALETDLRQGLQQHEFFLHYQRQTDTSGRTVGAEALVRWQHPRRGLVSPALFIPLAEETGLILRLGHWVLETACRQLALWAAKPETSHLTVAVNVSARQFRQPDFVARVLSVLECTGANPQNLKLELTESLLVENVETTITKMTALKAKGVSFSLDDFGTGYSSLAYLKRLPLDQLKIDRSFVKDVLTDANDAAIARTIVALGQTLGLEVIAEGVETEDQRDFLALNGCHVYQGYLFSQPLPAEQF